MSKVYYKKNGKLSLSDGIKVVVGGLGSQVNVHSNLTRYPKSVYSVNKGEAVC